MDTHAAALATHALRATRRIPAPPAAVFAAWTDPARLRQWFGPAGMTVTEAEVDLRPGGMHRTVMRDADGKTWPNRLTIDEVAPPYRLVLRVTEDACGPLIGATGTVTFAEEDGGTRLDVLWQHPTEEMRAAHEAMGFVRGWGETLDRLTAHVAAPGQPCPGALPPSPEHGWLHRMLGDWRQETECRMGPDAPPMQATATERVRSLGGYWVVGEGEGAMPGGGHARWTVTLGWDQGARTFRGSFVGSMMPHMFVYAGTLSPDGRTLTLDTEGPAMTGEGRAAYRDEVTLLDEDHRTVTSSVQGPDGAWTTFMTARLTRIG
ncbi:DUF1579 family protein [Falsiroseomonas sp. CW058]|uniref:DUF1579 family protein n=1 Tax=Falsiroseomonas sp. CW058 TaxID=3388664 RepID=UPI003D31AEC0